MTFSGMMHVFASMEASIFLPYLYTRVRCCDEATNGLGSHYDVTSPTLVARIIDEAKALGLPVPEVLPDTHAIAACEVPKFSRHSELWALSSHCTNKAFVQDSAQRVIGIATALQKVLCLLVMPMGGAIADAYGRRPVLFLYTVWCFLGCCILLFDASVAGAWGSVPVILGALLFIGQWDPKDAVIGGAVADVVGSHEGNKVRAYGYMFCFNTFGAMAGTIVAFLCLRLHVDNYTVPWLIFTLFSAGVIGVLLLFVPETLPRSFRRPQKSLMNPFVSFMQAVRLVSQDRVLIGMGICIFLFYVYYVGFLFTFTSYLLTVGFNFEEILLPRMVGFACEILVSTVVVPLLPQVRLWTVAIVAHFLFFVSYLLWGPWIILVGHSGAYLGQIVGSCAMPLLIPVGQTLVSQRVAKEHQSQCQAALLTCGTLGMVFGAPTYSRILFDGTARGMWKATPAFVSAFLAFLCGVMTWAVAGKAYGEGALSGSSGLEMHGRVLARDVAPEAAS